MSSKTKLKLSIFSFILLIGAIIFFITMLPFLVSTDTIRLRLARDLSTMTGYNVQLREPPQITVFPSFKATLPHVRLTDNTQSNAPLMEADKIIVYMSLWDAIRGRARFSQTELINPHFTIEEPVKAYNLFAVLAKSNGSFGNALRATQDQLHQQPANNEQQLIKASVFSQPFGEIKIIDGQLSYPNSHLHNHNNQHNTDNSEGENLAITNKSLPYEQIHNINAEISWPQQSNNVSLKATAIWHEVFNSLNVEANNAILLLSGGESNIRASFNSAKGGITFTGKARFGQNFNAQGTLSARSPAINSTLNWLGLRPPFGAKIPTPFIWKSNVAATAKHAELKNIVLTIGDDTTGDSGRGALELNMQDHIPYISGSLAFGNLNIGQISPSIFAVDFLNSADSDTNDNPPIFGLFGLDLRVSSSQVNFNGIPVNNPAASIQVQKNGLIFDIGTMQIFDGFAQSSLHINSENDHISGLDMRFTSTDTNLTTLRHDLNTAMPNFPEITHLNGKANLSLTLQAKLPVVETSLIPIPTPKPEIVINDLDGASQTNDEPNATSYSSLFLQNIWPYADGQFKITMNEGNIANFNMPQFMNLVNNQQDFSLAKVYQTDQQTAFNFNNLAGTFIFSQQMIKPISIRLGYDNHLLKLDGEIDTKNNQLKFAGKFDPLQRNSVGQCTLVSCLQQSLLPTNGFAMNGSFFAPQQNTQQLDKRSIISPLHESIVIRPNVGILPY